MADEKLLLESGSVLLLESGSALLLETILGGSGPPDISPPTIFIQPAGTDEILNLSGIGQRTDTFLFELLDLEHNKIGDLDVNVDTAPRIVWDGNRSIGRTCTGLTVSRATQAAIDTQKERLRVKLRLENGAEFSLGVFAFGESKRKLSSWGSTWTPDLFDETFIVDQALSQPVSIPPGGSLLQLFSLLIAQVGLPAVDLGGVPDAISPTALSYEAGKSRNQALLAVATSLGCYPPFFDNDGVYRLKVAPAPGSGADHAYGPGTRIIADSVELSDASFRAPNRYQVISSNTDGFVVGIYDLPPSSPHSFENLDGQRIVKSRNADGIPTTELANLAAYIDALTDRTAYTRASFTSTVDPRHDCFDRVDLYGTPYVEMGWSIVCSSGGPMTHTLVGIF